MIDTAKLAKLSKLSFTEIELADMEKDMASIVELMDTLKDAVFLTENTADEFVCLNNLRPDIVEPSMSTEKLLASCNGNDDECFTIPKVVE